MNLAVDTETTGLDWHDQPFCVTMAMRDESGTLRSRYFELSEPASRADAMQLMMDADKLIFHNAKFDIQKLILAGLLFRPTLNAERIHDTEALAHLLDEHRPKGLKVLARTLLGKETDEDTVIRETRRKLKLTKADGYDKLPREVIIPYALKDAEYTLLLWEKLYPQLMKYDDLAGLYLQEQRLMLVLLDMEARGLALDLDYLDSTAKEYGIKALNLELDMRERVGDPEFKPGSWQQVLAYLHEEGVEATGTSADELKNIDHPLAAELLEFRGVKKVHKTYLVPLQHEQKGGIVHPWTRQYNTKTGRMASGGASN